MFTWRDGFGWGELEVGVFVMIHGTTAPHDADWDDCMAALARFSEAATPRALVFTDGGAPKGPQRAALNRLVGKSPPTAVVSDALVTRFVVSSFALMNSSIASFTTSEIELAWQHLGVEGPSRVAALSSLTHRTRAAAASFVTLRRALHAQRR